MIGQITFMKTEVYNNIIHATIRFEGDISIEEFNDINKTFESFRHEGNSYRIKKDKKYVLIERTDK